MDCAGELARLNGGESFEVAEWPGGFFAKMGAALEFGFAKLMFFFPRASERRVFHKEGGVNRSTYKRYLLTSSRI